MKILNSLAAIAVAFILCVGAAGPAWAVVQPTSVFYAADYADVLSSATENDIVEKNDYLYDRTGAQIVVVTVQDTEGLTLEEYGYQLANSWGIGTQGKDNGVLLLLSIGDQDYQCMQGAGLEDELPTITLSRILQEDMEPDFAAGNYDAGVQKTFDALYTQVCVIYGLSPEGAEGYAPGYGVEYGVADETRSLVSIIMQAAIFLIVVIAFVAAISSLARPRRNYTRHYYAPPPMPHRWSGSDFFTGMLLGSAMSRRRNPPRRPGGFGGGLWRGGGGGSFRGGGGFHGPRGGGGGSFRGGGAGRRH